MDTAAIIGIALGALAFGMLYGLRRRVTHLENMIARLQGRISDLESAPVAGAVAKHIDIEPFVD